MSGTWQTTIRVDEKYKNTEGFAQRVRDGLELMELLESSPDIMEALEKVRHLQPGIIQLASQYGWIAVDWVRCREEGGRTQKILEAIEDLKGEKIE